MVDDRSSSAAASKATEAEISTELSKRRTGMSFQRTRMSADRTLMSVMRTSISLISFGFTIFQFFSKYEHTEVLAGRPNAARNFGQTLVWLGIAMLVVGIVYHLQFMRALRHERQSMKTAGLIHAESPFPPSMTLITASILLAVGIIAILSMSLHVGPFG